MATPVIMPKQGQSVETCLITRWFKNVGDPVENGDLLFAYETDKAAFDEESKVSGELLAIFYEAGDEVPVLENVCVIGSPGETVDSFRPGNRETWGDSEPAPGQQPDQQGKLPAEPSQLDHSTGQVTRVSPRARRMAGELGVQVAELKGSGPGNRIMEKDVLEAYENRPRITPLAREMMDKDHLVYDTGKFGRGNRVTSKDLHTPETDKGMRIVPLSKIRRIIAENMHRSLQNSAQLTHHLSADARNILALRKTFKDKQDPEMDITLNDMVCYAVVKSLAACPEMNAQFRDDEIWIYDSVHLAIAVHTERGLMVPTLLNAETFDLKSLSRKLKDLARDCQEGHINPDLLHPQTGTFTVSNLGAYGIEMFTPVLNVPQVGILGVNTIQLKPVDMGNGSFGFIPHIGLSLTYDHRAIDGAPASAFLKLIREQIESFDPAPGVI